MMRTILPILSLCLISGVAQAHPGHVHAHDLGGGLLHPFLGLDHLLAILGVGLWAAHLDRKSSRARSASIVSAMAVTAFVAFTHAFSLGFILGLVATTVSLNALAIFIARQELPSISRQAFQYGGASIAAFGFAMILGLI